MHPGVFDIFKVGIGPSSSHTMGPMRAAREFLVGIDRDVGLPNIERISVEVLGSFALAALGHGTDLALLLGLSGHEPDTVNPDEIPGIISDIRERRIIQLLGRHEVPFEEERDVALHPQERLPFHPNALRFVSHGKESRYNFKKVYYSIGGGFVVSEDDTLRNTQDDGAEIVPYPFDTGAELLELCREHGLTIAEAAFANECQTLGAESVTQGLDHVWSTMEACIDRGCRSEGILPGGLDVERRAATLCRRLRERRQDARDDPLAAMDWLNIWAIAVNEENAAGGRVVTAPTNGAAGIIPSVLRYFDRYQNRSGKNAIHAFLLTAAAIGALYKKNASISGAEVGCQGEVGVACSMAAAGLTAAMDGSNEQVENAAEIGMEHNLGLTCDPIGSLVQVPCIERNAVAAVKAVDASRLALLGDGRHKVSLDNVIETMRQTGLDMQDKYKETSEGGLAVNVVEC